MAKKTTTVKRKVNSTTKKAVNDATNSILDKVSGGENSLSKNKTIKKLLKQIPTLVKVVGITLFVVGCLAGAVVGNVLSKNDTFELVGSNVSYEINSTAIYQDEGVKLVSMGRDLSNKVNIEVSKGLIQNDDGTFRVQDTSKEGMYYIIYTTTDFKFSKIRKIRYIYVADMSEQGESISDSLNTESSLGGYYE